MEPSDLESARLAVTSAALSGDPGGLYHIVAGLLGSGVTFERVLYDLLMPAERDLGSRWQQGDYLVAEEHAATSAIETVVSLLAGSFDQPKDGKTIVVAAAEGDDHSLPTRTIAAHLLFLGYRILNLGASVPAADLTGYLEAEQPTALVLSCAMSSHLPGARAIIAASHGAGVPVLAGGNGFGPGGRWAFALGADGWVGSLEDVPNALEGLSADLSGSEGRAMELTDQIRRLIDDWPGIIARARSLIPAGVIEANQNARMLTEIGLALDSVIASLLVEDPLVAEEMLAWQQMTLPAHGIDCHDAMVDALGAALSETAPPAAAILDAARADL